MSTRSDHAPFAKPRRLAALVLLATAITASESGAEPLRPGTSHFDLGQGRVADRTMGTGGRGRGTNIAWNVVGFTPPPAPERVIAYASHAHRIVALSETGVHVTDDGAHWHLAHFASPILRPLAIALGDGGFGALVTASHGVWFTGDGGDSWRELRDAMSNALDDVAVVARTIVFTDVVGGAWTVDEAGSLRTLCTPPASGTAASLVSDTHAEIVFVRSDHCNWRVDATSASEL